MNDNIKYLKKYEKNLYNTLRTLATSAFQMYESGQKMIDTSEKFEAYLNMLKSNLLEAIQGKFRKNNLSKPEILTQDNYRSIVNIFERMFLSAVDQMEFNELDPEVQELYLEAQRIINEEQESESST